jgi:RecB family endonuclease NucS
MADLLLSERGESSVRKNWTTTFIKRRTELKAKFSRKYDYKRAKCEDPKLIEGWFTLVRNIVMKYGILEQDIYNFDEAGFAMGVIATTKVVTSSEAKSRLKTIQPRNREWVLII